MPFDLFTSIPSENFVKVFEKITQEFIKNNYKKKNIGTFTRIW